MGSGNSTPVEKANNVETETHQDLVEIRFDHMAFGGTVALIVIMVLLFYLLRLRRKLHRTKRRLDGQPAQSPSVAASMQPQQPWYQPPPYFMPPAFGPDNGQMIRLERLLRQAEIVDSTRRFEELPTNTNGLPHRPAPGSLLPLPNPGQRGGSSV